MKSANTMGRSTLPSGGVADRQGAPAGKTSAIMRGLAGLALAAAAAGCTDSPYYDAYNVAKKKPYPTPDSATHVCPDQQSDLLYQLDGSKTWVPTRCESVIIKAAIDHCLRRAQKTNMLETLIADTDNTGNAVVTALGLGAGVAGLAIGSTPVALAGAGTLATTLTSDFGKISPGSAPTTSVSNMWSAAQSYAMANQYLQPPQGEDDASNTFLGHEFIQHTANPFYAGLWNAVGSACPGNMMGGGFKSVKLPKASDNELSFFTPINETLSDTSTVTADSTPCQITSALVTRLNNDADLDAVSIIQIKAGKPVSKDATCAKGDNDPYGVSFTSKNSLPAMTVAISPPDLKVTSTTQTGMVLAVTGVSSNRSSSSLTIGYVPPPAGTTAPQSAALSLTLTLASTTAGSTPQTATGSPAPSTPAKPGQ